MPELSPSLAELSKQAFSKDTLLAAIRENVVGERRPIEGPYGTRPLVYADYIASGRSLHFIEAAIEETVLPVYGNTHTETSYTGREITALREEARRIIAESVGASDDHVVIFTGAGATSAVDRLVRGMEIDAKVRAGEPVVVFVGPYEHHSNDLPWRESGAQIERIPLDESGMIDLDCLKERLDACSETCLKIGAFSAASNITGVRTDLAAIGKLMHSHGGYFVCDFAAAAPYVDMKLHLSAEDKDASIDAIVYSSHKFIGGPGASGVLIAATALFTNCKPGVTGGGTVSYVTADHHTYVADIERREEGGTPNIVGDIRAGTVVALKQAVGAKEIETREHEIISTALKTLSQAEGVDILGPLDKDRIGVLSFNIKTDGMLLHYGFVVALLNDLFGIQARGGCSCAGPYAHELLEISSESAHFFEDAIQAGQSLMRPGWIRLGYNYFFDAETVNYITKAILFISQFGAYFLQDYEVDVAHGIWRNKSAVKKKPATLMDFRLSGNRAEPSAMQEIEQYLVFAQELASQRVAPVLLKGHALGEAQDAMRNFWMPQDLQPEQAEAKLA